MKSVITVYINKDERKDKKDATQFDFRVPGREVIPQSTAQRVNSSLNYYNIYIVLIL